MAAERVVEPVVDLVIPVHDYSRPIRRAVESALEDIPPGLLRVTVVCHGIERDAIAEKLTGLAVGPGSEAVRIVEFADGIRSPAGPFNHGLFLATAPYVAVMGSDDFLEPGAMRSWVEHVRARPSDAVLVRLRHQGGDKLDNPLPRRGRTENLDPVRDRLFYRTAPLGLLSRSAVDALDLRFTERVPVGKDMNFSARLWASGATIDYLRDEPCYVIGSDAESRVTTQRRPVGEAMAAVRDLARRNWVADLPRPTRRSLAIKLLRIHILGALTARPERLDWSGTDLDDLRHALGDVTSISPSAVHPFALADRALLESVRNPATTVDSLVDLIGESSRAGRFRSIMPRNPFLLLDREGTLVRYLLYKVGP